MPLHSFTFDLKPQKTYALLSYYLPNPSSSSPYSCIELHCQRRKLQIYKYDFVCSGTERPSRLPFSSCLWSSRSPSGTKRHFYLELFIRGNHQMDDDDTWRRQCRGGRQEDVPSSLTYRPLCRRQQQNASFICMHIEGPLNRAKGDC